MYTIKLADGTVLENLEMNCNTFISPTEVTDEMLNEEALAEVTITETPEDGDPIVTVLSHARYDKILTDEDGWHFVLWGESEQERKFRELREDFGTAINELLDFVIGGE